MAQATLSTTIRRYGDVFGDFNALLAKINVKRLAPTA